jgi:transposase
MSENPNENEVVEERPSTEVVTRAARRRYTAEYKLRILREVEACKGTGEIGARLRREGLYSSNLTKWREQRARGELAGLAEQRRGPKEDPQAVENAQLKRENERLREELRKAHLIIEVQKKVSQLLGVPLEEPQEEDRSK